MVNVSLIEQKLLGNELDGLKAAVPTDGTGRQLAVCLETVPKRRRLFEGGRGRIA
jgi:hypothetical protein